MTLPIDRPSKVLTNRSIEWGAFILEPDGDTSDVNRVYTLSVFHQLACLVSLNYFDRRREINIRR